jgi:protease II
MSGQPNRYSTSAEKFRNQYMDALNIRANVDDYNLQANKNYKATGSLPPQIMQMMDNRTTTEILADSEKLKLNIINELKQVMTTSTSSVVVQKIQTAPVNADGSFLVWTAQNMPEIVRNLKKK